MKKNSLIPALTGVLLVLTLFLTVVTYFSIQYNRKARRIQSEVAISSSRGVIVDALAREALVYSQSNHAIDPILLSVGLNPGQAAPAPKPATR